VKRLTHVDGRGHARMVDVGAKAVSKRRAVAEGCITMSREAFALIRANRIAKGDVLAVAELAGVVGAKRTPDLIPLAHPLPLTRIAVTAALDAALPGVRVRAEAKVEAKTGVEMEALTACAVALLAVYDMAKAVDRSMVIGAVRLVEKSGGRSGDWTRAAAGGARRRRGEPSRGS
jgi:cyclic pyranopterin monophosphate synthase